MITFSNCLSMLYYFEHVTSITAYQHTVSRGIELMITEAIIKASPYLKFCGKSIPECLEDMEAYCKLDDGIFYLVSTVSANTVLNMRKVPINGTK